MKAVTTLCALMAAMPAVSLLRPDLGAKRAPKMRTRLSMSTEDPYAVKSVSQTMRAFESLYQRPVVTIWRGSINDMLQVTHLSTVDRRFKYDAIFGYGYMVIYNMLLEKYPVAGEKDKLIDATIKALDLDPVQIRADYTDVAAWVEGKSEADVLAAASGGADKASAALAAIKASDNYLHTRSANFAVLNMMESTGCKAESATLDRWTEAFGMRKKAVEMDAVLLKQLKEKLSGAMQIIKQMEIREKKRMADALEAKAKAVQEKAQDAADAADEIKEAQEAQ